MKKIIYFLIPVLIFILNLSQAYSQLNTVSLTPPVGPAVLFPSITLAYAAIPPGLTGNYLVEILPGYDGTDASETYPIQLTDKTSGVFTITLRPAAGNLSETIQKAVSGPGAVIQINGGDNVIIDGRPGGVTTSSTDYLNIVDLLVGDNTTRNIEVINSANNNIIQFVNSTAALPTPVAGSRNILIGGTTTVGNVGNIVRNNIVRGGLRGIQDFGTVGFINSGTQITFNDVADFGAIGIFSGTNQRNITVMNNRIHGLSFVSAAADVRGISHQGNGIANFNNNEIDNLNVSTAAFLAGFINLGFDTVNVNQNLIHDISTAAAVPSIYAIGNSNTTSYVSLTVSRNQVYNVSSTGAVDLRGMSMFFFAGSFANINNNFISLTQANTNASVILGIIMGVNGTNTYTTNLYYNSVRIGGVHTGGAVGTVVSAGISRQDNNAGSVFNMLNNVAINDRSAGTAGAPGVYHVGFANTNAFGTLNINYNTYYGTNGVVGNAYSAFWGAVVYDNSSLVTYKAAALPNEQNTRFLPVNFISNTDLHLTAPSIGDLNLAGISIPSVTFDIDGQVRNSTPYIGADENVVPLPVELASFTSSVNVNKVTLNWSTVTELNNSGFDIERASSGTGSYTKVGNVAGRGNSNTTVNYTFNENNVASGRYNYRLKQIDFNGNFKYYNLSSEVIVGIPAKYDLSQNYPNPFNPTTKINYTLPADGKVSIKLFDMAGKEVANIVNTVQTAGYYSVDFNASNLSSGTYFYTITANNFVATKKMMLVK